MFTGDALFSKTRQRILSLLYGKVDQRFYTNEIVRWVKVGTGSVQRELERLVSSDILIRSREGNQSYYQANPANPIFAELVAIVKKTFGVTEHLKQALLPIDKQLYYAFIYGSIAKGSETASSDIDVMLVGDELDYGEVMALLMPVEELVQRPINPTLYTVDEFKKRLIENNHFVVRLMERPRLMIKGEINDIGEFVKD